MEEANVDHPSSVSNQTTQTDPFGQVHDEICSSGSMSTPVSGSPQATALAANNENRRSLPPSTPIIVSTGSSAAAKMNVSSSAGSSATAMTAGPSVAGSSKNIIFVPESQPLNQVPTPSRQSKNGKASSTINMATIFFLF